MQPAPEKLALCTFTVSVPLGRYGRGQPFESRVLPSPLACPVFQILPPVRVCSWAAGVLSASGPRDIADLLGLCRPHARLARWLDCLYLPEVSGVVRTEDCNARRPTGGIGPARFPELLAVTVDNLSHKRKSPWVELGPASLTIAR